MADGVYGMAPSINYVCSYDVNVRNARKGVCFVIKFVPMSFIRTNVIMAILNLTTIAIQRQLLATRKWQSRQGCQLVGLKMIVADDNTVT